MKCIDPFSLNIIYIRYNFEVERFNRNYLKWSFVTSQESNRRAKVQLIDNMILTSLRSGEVYSVYTMTHGQSFSFKFKISSATIMGHFIKIVTN